MNTTALDTKRISIFLAFAFGIAWLVALVIYLTGGLTNSPAFIPGTAFNLAFVLTTLGYMGAPALANVLTRLVTGEGWQNTFLRPNFRKGWKFWAAAWFLPGIFTLLGAAVYFAIFPGNFDSTGSTVRGLLGGRELPMDLWLLVLIQTAQALLIAPIVNSLFTFGEEFGWRAYLLQKFLPLGERRAYVVMGVIWGLWHAPMIAMGHNYGLNYPGAPWLGIVAMTWFTMLIGIFLGWAALRGGSVWPAVIGHAAINGIAGISILFTQGNPSLLIGPAPIGIVGAAAFTAAAALIFWKALPAPQAAI